MYIYCATRGSETSPGRAGVTGGGVGFDLDRLEDADDWGSNLRGTLWDPESMLRRVYIESSLEE